MQRLQAKVCSSSDFVSAVCPETMSAGSGLAGATGGRQASPTHLNSPTLLPNPELYAELEIKPAQRITG